MRGVLMSMDGERWMGDMRDAFWQNPIGCNVQGGCMGCQMGEYDEFSTDLKFKRLIKGWWVRERMVRFQSNNRQNLP